MAEIEEEVANVIWKSSQRACLLTMDARFSTRAALKFLMAKTNRAFCTTLNTAWPSDVTDAVSATQGASKGGNDGWVTFWRGPNMYFDDEDDQPVRQPPEPAKRARTATAAPSASRASVSSAPA